MSAYICDKNHICFLVEAATSPVLGDRNFSWHMKDDTQRFGFRREELRRGENPQRAADVANMLWRENIKSVSARYPNESSATLPGPINGPFVIEPGDFPIWTDITAVQVLKSCDCYAYQTCEHDGWEASEAKSFIDALRAAAWHRLPGYDKAEWGAPKPYPGKLVRLSSMAN